MVNLAKEATVNKVVEEVDGTAEVAEFTQVLVAGHPSYQVTMAAGLLIRVLVVSWQVVL